MVGATKVGMSTYHATWFIPTYISERITDFKKLTNHLNCLKLYLADELEISLN
jgi:putative hydrolase of the HAD superfamily